MKESYINISGPTAAIIPDEVVLERSQRVGVARFEYLDKIAAFPQAELWFLVSFTSFDGMVDITSDDI